MSEAPVPSSRRLLYPRLESRRTDETVPVGYTGSYGVVSKPKPFVPLIQGVWDESILSTENSSVLH